jgi:hypothetical protein
MKCLLSHCPEAAAIGMWAPRYCFFHQTAASRQPRRKKRPPRAALPPAPPRPPDDLTPEELAGIPDAVRAMGEAIAGRRPRR